MDVKKVLRPLREAAGMTQQDLADRLDVSRVAVYSWESGKATPRPAKLEQMSSIFGVSLSTLLGEKPMSATQALPHSPQGLCEIRSSLPLRCINNTHSCNESNPKAGIARVEVPSHVVARHPNGFALQIEDDCMDRAYPQGCVAVADPDEEPQPGCAVVAETGSGEAVVRRYNRGASTLMLSPDSHNPEHADLVFNGEDLQRVRILGVVVWYQAPCGELSEL